MSSKPNFSKWILGVTILTLMFIGTWAATSTPSTSAKKISNPISNMPSNATAARASKKAPNLNEPVSIATPTPVGDVFELDKNALDDASPLDDWQTLNNGGGHAIATTLDAN